MHELLNTPDTISLGYNSLGFDDEFLRFLFYRNLLDPYTHQYAGGCYRADILPVTALYNRFCDPPVIRWPRLEKGRPTLKLEHIARENRFNTSGPAHDAMADVEALVALCRRFAEKADVWTYALGYFDKQTDLKRMEMIAPACQIQDRFFRNAVMISASFGAEAGYLAPVLHIGRAIPYSNQDLWIRLDRPECGNIDPDTRQFDWFPIRKKPADQWLLLPPADRFTGRLTHDAQEIAAAVVARFREKATVFQKTVQAHRTYAYPIVPDLDPDAALYQEGFFTVTEKKDIARFHEAVTFGRAGKTDLSALPATLQSPRVRTLAARILARNFDLPGSAEFKDHLEKLGSGGEITGFRSESKVTLQRAVTALKQLGDDRQQLSQRQRHALNAVETYLRNWAA